jgi:predicted phosphate transport protein (TIGR00153 family)
MVIRKFFPKETDFFRMFEKAALNLGKGAALLVEMMENFPDAEVKAKQIYEAEQDGDMLTHEVMRELNKTFLTPVDREDIHALVSNIDDILDLIWAVADRTILFKLSSSTAEAIELSKILLSTTEIITKSVISLKGKKYPYVQEFCIEINRLENHGDSVFRAALAKMFDEIKDPILIIKWKEVYEHLEEALDKCEDVADILESIVIKHA